MSRPAGRPASPAYLHFLVWEGSLAVVFGAFGLVMLPVRAAEAAAGVVLSPVGVISALPVVALLLRGWWLLRLSRAGVVRATGGLVPRERHSVRTRLRVVLVLVVVTGVLVPEEYTAVHAVFGVLAVLYGVLVLLQMRRFARPAAHAA